MVSDKLTQERLKQVLDYDPETGVFTWKSGVKKHLLNKQAGCHRKKDDCVVIGIKRKSYLAHHLAWLFVYGDWPKHEIDHINQNRSDNKIANLRDVDHRTNCQNYRIATKNNKNSKLLGAAYRDGRYYSRIRVGNKRITLGSFATAKEAHEAYVVAKRQHHPGCTI
jgi:hypothetical protein